MLLINLKRYQCLTRHEIRNIFKIKGDDIEDGVMSCCCTCCALVQQEKEVVTRLEQIDTRGYVRQPEMQMR
jgi:Cys-rich protein (TIGR01571 family)